jgi:hypothetical protein
MRYTDRAQDLYINLHKGYQHLDGEKAMEYVRFRHDLLGDITRMQRQQKFLKAVMQKMMQPATWPKIPGIVVGSRQFIETDILPNDLTALMKVARGIQLASIKMETLPGSPGNIGGVSYYLVDDAAKTQMVQTFFLAPSTVTTADSNVPRPSVQILNGNGTVGLASKARKVFETNGYKVVSTGNADVFTYESSQVIAPEKLQDGAKAIAQLLGCGTVVVSRNTGTGDAVTVILGKDYQAQSN